MQSQFILKFKLDPYFVCSAISLGLHLPGLLGKKPQRDLCAMQLYSSPLSPLT